MVLQMENLDQSKVLTSMFQDRVTNNARSTLDLNSSNKKQKTLEQYVRSQVASKNVMKSHIG